MYAIEFDNDRLSYVVRHELNVKSLDEAIEAAASLAVSRPAGDEVRIGLLVKTFHEFRGTVWSIPHPDFIGVVGYDRKIYSLRRGSIPAWCD